MPVDKYTSFFKRECEVILNKIVETVYDKLEGLECVPLAPAEGAGLDTITWRAFTSVGIAKIISDYETNIPSTETYGSEQSVGVYHIASSFGWSKFELEKAMRAGRSLVDTKSKAARIAMETKVDDLIWSGDEKYKIYGFLNFPGVLTPVLPDSEQVPGSKKWEDKSPEEIAADINLMIDTIRETTSYKEDPNTVIMPPQCMRFLTTRFIDPNKEMTVLDYVKKCNPSITTWKEVARLSHAGTNKSGMIIVYDNNSDKLEFHMPVPINNEEPERDGLRYDVVLTADVGSLTIYYPQSVARADGVC